MKALVVIVVLGALYFYVIRNVRDHFGPWGH
jgi:hypothetical protein